MAFKYNGAKGLAEPLAYLMAQAWREGRQHTAKRLPGIGARDKPRLAPIPMHQAKEEARGYNQSMLLAAALSRETGFPVAELLIRPRIGQMQAGLDKQQRRIALDQVFRWAGSEDGGAGPVILVDDVVTTGATLETCGQLLCEKGYGPIWGLTFAGGSGGGARHDAKIMDS
jgi:ComF family protein